MSYYGIEIPNPLCVNRNMPLKHKVHFDLSLWQGIGFSNDKDYRGDKNIEYS
jgi:hypothetical protein